MKTKIIFLAILFSTTLFTNILYANEWGSFSGTVVSEWLSDHRKMKLIEKFIYTDPDEVNWVAEKGSIIDGASIPRFAWSVIGGPYEGPYRNASVIHDVACVEKNKPWRQVHKAFYTAMRASRVDQIKAKIMYAAVYHFGPRWGILEQHKIVGMGISEFNETVNGFKMKYESGAKVEIKDRIVTGSASSITHPMDNRRVQAVIEVKEIQPSSNEEAFRAMEHLIKEKELSLDEIEQL
jgi:hypothetical protein